ncbi:MAG: hypothetical protein ACPG7U_01500 [Holosporaceae bacterium]
MSIFQKIFFAFIICGSFIWQPQGLLAQTGNDTKFEGVDLGGELSPTDPPKEDLPPTYGDVVSSQEGQKQSWGEMFKGWGQKLKQSNPFRKKTATEKTIKKHRALKRQLKPRIESLGDISSNATAALETFESDQKNIEMQFTALNNAIADFDKETNKNNSVWQKITVYRSYRNARDSFRTASTDFYDKQIGFLSRQKTDLRKQSQDCDNMKKILEGHLSSICDINKSPDKRYDGFEALKEEKYTQINSDIKKSRELVSVTKENLREFNKLRKKFFKKCNEAVNAMGSALKTLLYKWPKAGLKATRQKLEAAATQTARFGSWLKKKAGEGATKVGLSKKPGGGSSNTHISLTSTSPAVS